MKRILAIAFAVVAVTIMTDASANAQINSSGYGFGVGLNQAGGGFCGGGFLGVRSAQRFEQPPYFARFPPVYYDRIVRRPYGISPYAAPAGVTPVELTVPAIDPVTVKNKFFDSKVAPVADSSNMEKSMNKTDNKTTAAWVSNPYVETLAAK